MLMKMAEVSTVKFNSGNSIRNGSMGFVIKLANLIKKQKDSLKDETDLSQVFSDKWTSFVDSELSVSNERNSRSLGGKPTST